MPELIIRNIAKNECKLYFDSDKVLVKDIKECITKEEIFNKPSYDVQKLICAGKILSDNDEIEITARTQSRYEGNKINKLLIAVIIIIAKLLSDKFKWVVSNAVHIASLHLMTTHFNAIPYGGNPPTEMQLDYNKMSDYLKLVKSVTTKVLLNEINIKNAENVFNTVAENELICEPHDTQNNIHQVVYSGKRKSKIKNNLRKHKKTRKNKRKSNRRKYNLFKN